MQASAIHGRVKGKENKLFLSENSWDPYQNVLLIIKSFRLINIDVSLNFYSARTSTKLNPVFFFFFLKSDSGLGLYLLISPLLLREGGTKNWSHSMSAL